MLRLGTVNPPAEGCSGLDPAYLSPPMDLIETGFIAGGGIGPSADFGPYGPYWGRANEPLWDAATRLRDGGASPEQVLAEAAVEYLSARLGRGGSPRLALALADVTVTGRAAWGRFRARPPRDAAVRAAAVAEGARRGVPTDRFLDGYVRAVLDRAYVVAWNLRGPLGFRERSRPAQGWIASVGESDPPHRPLNVPVAPFPQYDLDVTVARRRITTRIVLASSRRPDSESFDWSRLDLRTLPSEREPWIPEEDDVIVFIHGHSSRAEEALPLVSALHAEARRRGRSVTVLAFDLPSNGYSQMLDPEAIAPIERSSFHLLEPERPPDSTYPVLNFIEGHIRAVIHALDARMGIRRRIVGVVGGSLGGNMALRLGYRGSLVSSWAANRVSWSPASAWGPSWGGASINPAEYTGDPYRYYDHVKHEGVRITRDRASEAETFSRRPEYFRRVFRGTWPEPAQAPRWYRDGWPCKDDAIEAAIRDRMEVYHDHYRRWHWRVAHEQLIYSHFDPLRPGGPFRYTSMRGRLLLLVGTEDNHFPEYIHDRVIGDMASGLANRISGRAFGVAATGHSIQSERPRFLARTVLDFASQEMWALRAANGRFVTVSSDGPRRLVASSRMIGVWEQLRGIRQPNGEVAFEAASGHYLAAEDGGGREVVVDRFWIRSWERFEVVDLGDGNAAVRTTATRGRPVRYWQVRSDRGAEVHASAVAPSGDAVFRLIDLAGEPVRWRIGATTRFVGPVGRGFVVRSGAPVSVFRLVDLGRNEIAFHAPNGHFITAVTGGGAGLVAGGSSPGGWGVFVRDPIGDGSFLVRRGLRQYLVDRGGSLRADGTRAEATPMRFEPPAPVTVVEIAPEHRRAILGAVTRPFPEVIFRP